VRKAGGAKSSGGRETWPELSRKSKSSQASFVSTLRGSKSNKKKAARNEVKLIRIQRITDMVNVGLERKCI
jgi:hypothetical protein